MSSTRIWKGGKRYSVHALTIYLELSAKVQKFDKGYLYCNSEAVITYGFTFHI